MTDFEAPHPLRAASSDTEDRGLPIDDESILGYREDRGDIVEIPFPAPADPGVYEQDIHGDERGGQVPKRP